jgi:predicted nucleic acid-binding Zn ribbon protein
MRSLYGVPTYRIGGDDDCGHERRSSLGQMGPTALFACETCGGVLTASG